MAEREAAAAAAVKTEAEAAAAAAVKTEAEAEASDSGRPQQDQTNSTDASAGGGGGPGVGVLVAAAQAPKDENSDTARFSAAQLRVRLAQARLEAKMAADDELLALRKRLVEADYALQERERARRREGERLAALQRRVDGIAEEHRRTLSGMRGDLSTEKLVAALETEKEVRSRLRAAFETQSAELSAADRRVEALQAQVQHYQKTETVLSQSVAHFHHRFDAKEQQRAAALERARQKIEATFVDEVAALRRELELAKRTEKMAQDELIRVQRERDQLRERVENSAARLIEEITREDELLANVKALETDKAVLQSKAEQVEKADAQLRSKVNAQSEEIERLRQLNEGLQAENKELAELANELVEMAEKQHEEKKLRRRSIDPNAAVDADADADREEGELLQQRKKRIRLSLG